MIIRQSFHIKVSWRCLFFGRMDTWSRRDSLLSRGGFLPWLGGQSWVWGHPLGLSRSYVLFFAFFSPEDGLRVQPKGNPPARKKVWGKEEELPLERAWIFPPSSLTSSRLSLRFLYFSLLWKASIECEMGLGGWKMTKTATDKKKQKKGGAGGKSVRKIALAEPHWARCFLAIASSFSGSRSFSTLSSADNLEIQAREMRPGE